MTMLPTYANDPSSDERPDARSYDLFGSGADDRPPHWRWLSAQDYADNGRIPVGSEVGWQVRVAANHLRRARLARTSAQRIAMRRAQAGLASAIAVRHDRSRARANVIELGIVCRLRLADIAARAGVSRACVRWYRDLFLSVGRQLDRADYVLRHIIVPAFGDGADPVAAEHATALVVGYFVDSNALRILPWAALDAQNPSFPAAAEDSAEFQFGRELVALVGRWLREPALPYDRAGLAEVTSAIAAQLHIAKPPSVAEIAAPSQKLLRNTLPSR